MLLGGFEKRNVVVEGWQTKRVKYICNVQISTMIGPAVQAEGMGLRGFGQPAEE